MADTALGKTLCCGERSYLGSIFWLSSRLRRTMDYRPGFRFARFRRLNRSGIKLQVEARATMLPISDTSWRSVRLSDATGQKELSEEDNRLLVVVQRLPACMLHSLSMNCL
jgi:hypothetical protein